MKTIFTTAILLLSGSVYSQQLSQVTFSYDGRLSYFTIVTDQKVLIRISEDGQLLEYGNEEASLRNGNYYNPNLQPYMGRVENYGNETDSALRGKVKYIGTAAISWYAQYEMKIKVGKLKSLGRLMIDYYDNMADKNLQGKIKSLGNITFDYYYSTADNEAYRGKLKSISNTAITYYTSFDDRQVKGKIKSIGPVSYTWYTSFDLNRSGLKTGNYRSLINGVTYIIR